MNTKIAKSFKIAAIIISVVFAMYFVISGVAVVLNTDNTFAFYKTEKFKISAESLEEDFSDDTVCAVEFISYNGEYTCVKNYTPEEFSALSGDEEITGFIYTDDEDNAIAFSAEPSESDIILAVKNMNAANASGVFSVGMAFFLAAIGFLVITVFGVHFTNYEQIWFISILIIAAVFSVVFPEEDVNGVNGLVIMALYLADTFLNILCELLISKQSKWNFIVSVFVELTEIAICIVLAYRFATLASTLFFWLPCDIISFVNWHKHPDRKKEELTQVRSLKGWQEVLIIAGIIIWTVGIGYFLTTLDFGTDLFGGNRTLEIIVCFMDASASAVGIVNGVFILLRLREQWIAWFICAILEAAINIISGQYVLLVLKAGYFTNTTYGYIKWTKYIKSEQACENTNPEIEKAV